MSADGIRPIAICIVRRDDCILVGHAFDSKKNEHYCRPPGGGIDFGERAEDALRREIREEMEAEIEDVRLLSVIENLFELEGQPRHEIVFVFEARLANPDHYQTDKIRMCDNAWGGWLCWESLAQFERGERTLYPVGLLELLAERN